MGRQRAISLHSPADGALHGRVVPEASTLPVGKTSGWENAREAPLRPGQRDQIETPLPTSQFRTRHMPTGPKKMVVDRSAGVAPSRFTLKSPSPNFWFSPKISARIPDNDTADDRHRETTPGCTGRHR